MKNENLVKRTVRLDAEVLAEMQRFYPTLGYNEIIRKLMFRHVRLLRAREAEELSNLKQETKTNDGIAADTTDLNLDV